MLSTRSKTIIAIVGVILTISLSYMYFFTRQRDDNQQMIIDCKKDLVNTLVLTLTGQLDKQYSARITSFTRSRREIMALFAARDRQELLQRTAPVLDILQREDPYFAQIIFVLPDNRVFLHMEDSGAHGDSIPIFHRPERDDLDMQAEPLSGFIYDEEDLYYRIIQPVAYQERFIGRVVFDVHIGAVIEEIRDKLDMHTALAIRREAAGTPGQPAEGPPAYLIHDFGDPFFAENGSQVELSGGEQRLVHDSEVHIVFPSFVVTTPAGQEIGRIIQAVDISSVVAAYRRDILQLGLVSLVVLAVSSMILYLAFSRLYGRLMRLNETLNAKNEELEESGRRLGEKVADRTAELAEANARLQEEIELRRQANHTLSRSVEEWQSTFDSIADPVLILDRDLEVVIANRAAHDMLSRDESEIVGRTCHELFAGKQERCPTCPADDVFTRGEQKVYEVEHEYLGKNLLVSCAPIRYSGEVMGYVHTARDITQEKILKKQLSQAQKMEAIATLAGGIAHDFNNILGAILGNADLLLFRLSSQNGGDEEIRRDIRLEDVESHVQAIKKAGNRAKELVSQILAFSRQGKTQRQNAIITPVIKEAIKLLRSSLPANIEITSDIDPELCHIYADLTQIHQVFMNLCTNAAQALGDRGGTLSVRLFNVEAGMEERRRYPNLKPGRYAALAVEDNGHGMTPAIMERIFDPFFTTRDVGEGTGMGLAVIHGIITSHDGILDVKSKVDAGSVFTVFFPCTDENGKVEDDVILGMPRGSERIMFVDDEDDIVRMTTRMLEYLGYEVFPATSTEQALSMLGSGSFAVDLIITDYSMPGLSGTELAKKMAELRPGVPIMLCSGFSESVVFDDEARKVIRRYLSKPLDMKMLATAIREVLPPRKEV